MPVSKKRKKTVTNNKLNISTSNNTKILMDRVIPNFPNVKLGSYKKSISGMLGEFAKPLIDSSPDNENEIRKAVEFSVLIWNLAVTIKKDGNNKSLDKFLEMTIDKINISDKKVFKKEVEDLIKRKEYLFPDENILIADIEVSFDKNRQIRLSAAAFIGKEQIGL